MNGFEPIPFNDHLLQYGTTWILQPPSRVSKNFRLARGLERQIFSLGKNQFDFRTNYLDIFSSAKKDLTNSAGESVCGALVEASYQFSGEPFIDNDPNEPNIIANLSVGCKKAMVTTGRLVGEPAPVGLTDWRRKPYIGLRHFNGAIFAEMTELVSGVSERLSEETTMRISQSNQV